MYPPTHVLAIWSLKTSDSQRTWRIWLACFFGAIFADIPYLLQISVNLLQGKEIEGHTIAPLSNLSEYAHYFLAWLILWICVRKWQLPKVFAEASMLHLFVDMFTHGKGAAFHGCNYLFPLPRYVSENLGIWNYHVPGTGVHVEPFEAGLIAGLICFIGWRLWKPLTKAASIAAPMPITEE